MPDIATPSSNSTTHRQVWELLPWYVNRTLSESEAQWVQDHLAECALCQAELKRCEATATIVQCDDATAWEPSTQQFNDLMAQLEQAEPSPVPNLRTRLWQWLTASWEPLRMAPPTARWALVGQAALLVTASSLLVLQFAATPSEPYRTLANPMQPAAETVRINAVFAEDLSLGELRTLLVDLQATIVQGPSQQGVYTLARVAGSDPSAIQTQLLKILRQHPQVLLAEPALH